MVPHSRGLRIRNEPDAEAFLRNAVFREFAKNEMISFLQKTAKITKTNLAERRSFFVLQSMKILFSCEDFSEKSFACLINRARALAAHNAANPAGESPVMVNDDSPSSDNRRG
jgi:hypothetical protein